MLGRPLFVYGMLRDPDICAALIGRPLDRRNVAAALAPGFRVVRYPGRTYPALVRVPGGSAEGQVIIGLNRFEHLVLDAFEGEEYRRDVIGVLVEGELHEAEVYLPTARVGPEAEPWSFADWVANHKPAALVSELEAGAAIRAQVLAAGSKKREESWWRSPTP